MEKMEIISHLCSFTKNDNIIILLGYIRDAGTEKMV